MVWIAGESRAGYDHVGEWNKRIELAVEVPDAVVGDFSHPGEAVPGCFAPCEDHHVLRFTLEVI